MPTPPQIFDRIAHSSIMRLSESSMEKLYDLMTMGFKYQLVCCSHPGELLTITMNHLQVRLTQPTRTIRTGRGGGARLPDFLTAAPTCPTSQKTLRRSGQYPSGCEPRSARQV